MCVCVCVCVHVWVCVRVRKNSVMVKLRVLKTFTPQYVNDPKVPGSTLEAMDQKMKLQNHFNDYAPFLAYNIRPLGHYPDGL